MLNLSLKAEIQLQNENHTEDWALGSHPRDNGRRINYFLLILFNRKGASNRPCWGVIMKVRGIAIKILFKQIFICLLYIQGFANNI